MSLDQSDKSYRTYCREAAKTPLLTLEQEIQLADRIKVGDEEARTHMIKANLRLVVKIANDYANYGLPLLDLISEGNIGLIKAVERFDPNKGGKVSTYAAWWIKQSIKRALANQSKTIRLPVHIVEKLSKMRHVEMMLWEELGREPTNEELAEETGIPREKIAELKTAALRPTSLDAPIDTESELGSTFGDITPDEKAQNPLELLCKKSSHMDLDDLLKVLDERERKVIDARFGLNGQKAKTLEKVGEEFGVTRERIRQLQGVALRKLQRAFTKKEKPGPKPLKTFIINGTAPSPSPIPPKPAPPPLPREEPVEVKDGIYTDPQGVEYVMPEIFLTGYTWEPSSKQKIQFYLKKDMIKKKINLFKGKKPLYEKNAFKKLIQGGILYYGTKSKSPDEVIPKEKLKKLLENCDVPLCSAAFVNISYNDGTYVHWDGEIWFNVKFATNVKQRFHAQKSKELEEGYVSVIKTSGINGERNLKMYPMYEDSIECMKGDKKFREMVRKYQNLQDCADAIDAIEAFELENFAKEQNWEKDSAEYEICEFFITGPAQNLNRLKIVKDLLEIYKEEKAEVFMKTLNAIKNAAIEKKLITLTQPLEDPEPEEAQEISEAEDGVQLNEDRVYVDEKGKEWVYPKFYLALDNPDTEKIKHRITNIEYKELQYKGGMKKKLRFYPKENIDKIAEELIKNGKITVKRKPESLKDILEKAKYVRLMDLFPKSGGDDQRKRCIVMQSLSASRDEDGFLVYSKKEIDALLAKTEYL